MSVKIEVVINKDEKKEKEEEGSNRNTGNERVVVLTNNNSEVHHNTRLIKINIAGVISQNPGVCDWGTGRRQQ